MTAKKNKMEIRSRMVWPYT